MAARDAPGLFPAIDSAGTADYHTGERPDRRSIAAAARRGYDISDLRARQLVAEDFQRFDLLLAMDRSNLQQMRRLAPPGTAAQLRLFLDYAPALQLTEVPDPYYGQAAQFEHVIDLCEAAARGLISAVSA